MRSILVLLIHGVAPGNLCPDDGTVCKISTTVSHCCVLKGFPNSVIYDCTVANDGSDVGLIRLSFCDTGHHCEDAGDGDLRCVVNRQ